MNKNVSGERLIIEKHIKSSGSPTYFSFPECKTLYWLPNQNYIDEHNLISGMN